MRKAGRGRILDEQLVERTAVVYVFSGTDPEYERNLHFFIETGIQVCRAGLAPCSLVVAGTEDVTLQHSNLLQLLSLPVNGMLADLLTASTASSASPCCYRRTATMSTSSSSRWRLACLPSSQGLLCHLTQGLWSTQMSALTGAPLAGCSLPAS